MSNKQIVLSEGQLERVLYSLRVSLESHERLILAHELLDNPDYDEIARLENILKDTRGLIARFELIQGLE